MAGTRKLIVSDVDGTLLGDDAALNRFARWLESRRGEYQVVYASGRFFESLAESIRTTPLPDPDAVVGGVGTEIRSWPDGKEFAGWRSRLIAGWSATAVRRALANRGLSDSSELTLQPAELQSEFKVSYYLRDATAAQLQEMAEQLAAARVRCQMIYSSNRDLDVLPAAADKGNAAAFLADFWRIAADRVFVAGDSGNDRALFARGFRGVVVANAQPELLHNLPPEAYVASAPYAAGVLEGLERWLEQRVAADQTAAVQAR